MAPRWIVQIGKRYVDFPHRFLLTQENVMPAENASSQDLCPPSKRNIVSNIVLRESSPYPPVACSCSLKVLGEILHIPSNNLVA
jgi:hypothetical protein